MKKYLKKIFGFSLGPVVSAIIGFITIPITSNLIDADQFGLASMYNLLNNILTIVILVGIDQAYMREFNEEEDKEKLFTNAIFVPFILTIIFSIIIILFKDSFALLLFNDNNQIMPIIGLAICMPLFIVEKFFLINIRMQEKGFKYSFWTISSKFLNLVLTLLLLLLFKRNFESIIYASILSQTLTSLLIFIIDGRKIKIRVSKIEKYLLIKLLKFGFPLIPATIISWALNSMDVIFLRAFTNYSEVGYYSVALRFVTLLNIIQTSFTTLWAPVAFKWKKNNVSLKRFESVIEIITFSMSTIFILIMSFKWMIPYIISDNYLSTIFILPFLLFHPIFYTISETITLGISFSRKTHYNIVVSIVSLIVNLFLNWLLIPKFGGVGAAIATGISYMTFFWSRAIISRKLWFKFSLNKFVTVSVILFINAYVNSFIKDIFIVSIVNAVCLLIILFLYRNLLGEVKKFMGLKKNVGLISYKTQSKQFRELINYKNIKCNDFIIEGDSTFKNLFKLIKMILFCDLIYVGHGCHRNSKILKIIKFFRKKTIFHWIGSDVLFATENKESALNIQNQVIKNFACSDLISRELKDINISSVVIPVLPSELNHKLSKVPNEHAVISYIPEGNEEFYGIKYVKMAAKKYKNLIFYIVGNKNDTLNMPNVHFLGKISLEEMEDVYDKCSILLRLPEHDGLSLMLLEALLKGKHVIYCYDFPFCEQVSNEKDLYEKINKIIKEKPKVNQSGRDYVLKEFDVEKVKEQLNKLILECLEEC